MPGGYRIGNDAERRRAAREAAAENAPAVQAEVDRLTEDRRRKSVEEIADLVESRDRDNPGDDAT